jgi:peroxiredoxin
MEVPSVMLPLGTPAPPFSLRDVVSVQVYTLDSFTGKSALLVMFICRHCPYVVHVEQEIAKMGRDYSDTVLGIIGISSNDPAQYPDDAPPRLKEMAERLGFTFPFCFDETQDVAKAYRAACTPDFYLFDRERRLVYRGQLDDSRPGGNKPVTGRDRCGARREAGRGKPEGECWLQHQVEARGMTPMPIPCSRNAHNQNVLVRRPQWD